MTTFFYEIIDEIRDADNLKPLTCVSLTNDQDNDIYEMTIEGHFSEFDCGHSESLHLAMLEKLIEHGFVTRAEEIRFEMMQPLELAGSFGDDEEEDEDADFDDDEDDYDETEPAEEEEKRA